MGNIGTTFKKFLSNKNTVTFLCIVAGLLVLYIGYNYRIKQAINPVSVPYAKVAIDSRTKITAEMVGTTQVPYSLLKTAKTLVTKASNVIGQYSSYSTNIPKNSFFYTGSVMSEEEMPDYAFMNMSNDYTVFSLKVNMASTLANKIYPKTKIDLFVKMKDDNGSVVFGKLIESITVKAVKDSKGNALLENGDADATPSALLFEVDNSMFDLLSKTSHISGVDIIPVPRNKTYTAENNSTSVSSETIKNLILSKCVSISD